MSVKRSHAGVLAPRRGVIIVHGAAHVRLALATGLPFCPLSAPGAAGTLGVPWWRSLAEMAGQAADILDCGVDAAAALAALRAGQRELVLHGPFADRVTAIAASLGACVLDSPPPAFDLAHRGAARRLAAWLLEQNKGENLGDCAEIPADPS